MKSLRIFVTVLIAAVAFSVNAQQSTCDKLYNNATKLQQSMSVQSQNKAIQYFQKAKECYDSQARKDQCDQQITVCRNIIAQLQKPKEDAKVKDEPVAKDTVVVVKEPEPAKADVNLSFSENYLKFNGKGEFKKVKVLCNYKDWEIVECPSWVSCKTDATEIVIECEKNPLKEERSGILTVRCGNVTASLTIIQEKLKKFGVF